MTALEDLDLILFTRDLRRAGASDRSVRGSADWVRVRRGTYYPAQAWAALDRRARHAVLVHASARMAALDGLVLSHWSAAALWQLPVIGRWPDRIHVTMRAKPRSSQSAIQVHETFDPPEPVDVGGLWVTSPVRTVLDLSRCLPLTAVLPTADAALHSRLADPSMLRAAALSLPRGARGRVRAGLVADLADARAESPLESLSRAVMFEEGFPPPQLQIELRDEDGEFGRGDFGWPGLIGECDGQMKYGADLSSGDPSRVVWLEKQREDRIRRFAQVARWGWADAYHRDPLCRLLRSKGLSTRDQHPWPGRTY